MHGTVGHAAPLLAFLNKTIGELQVESLNNIKLQTVLTVLRNDELHGPTKTVRDLVRQTEADMMRVPKFGAVSLKMMKKLLDTHGLRFGMQDAELPSE